MDKKSGEKGNNWGGRERRRHPRIIKHFILSYFQKDDPTVKHDMSQLQNVSMGGVCFMTSHRYQPGTQLTLELKTPYLSDTTRLEGVVLESHEKLANILYETRVKFHDLTPQAKVILEKIVEHFQKGKTNNG